MPRKRHNHRVHPRAVRQVQRRRKILIRHVRPERHRERIALAVFNRAQRARGQEEIRGVRPAQRQGADGQRHLVPADVLHPERLNVRPVNLHIAEVLRFRRNHQNRLAQQRRPHLGHAHLVEQRPAQPVGSAPRLQAQTRHLRDGHGRPFDVPRGRFRRRNALAAPERGGPGGIVVKVVLQHHPIPVVGAVAVRVEAVGAGRIVPVAADGEGAVGPPDLAEFQFLRRAIHQRNRHPAVGALAGVLVAVGHQGGDIHHAAVGGGNLAGGNGPAVVTIETHKGPVAAERRHVRRRRKEHRPIVIGVIREHLPARAAGLQRPTGAGRPESAAGLVGEAVRIQADVRVGERLHNHAGLIGLGLNRRARRDDPAGVIRIAQNAEHPVVIHALGRHHVLAEARRRALIHHLGVPQRVADGIVVVQRRRPLHLRHG